MKYDFVEIGTSDFDTLIETADDNTVGLSIEPLKYYLDRLPDKPKVTKLNMAISSEENFMDIYYIPENQIIKHKLPYWVRGSNSVGQPHKFTIQEIGQELYDQIVKTKQIPCTTLKKLVADYDVTGIYFLKIDTEGMDHIILKDLVELCIADKELKPKKIKFERNPSVSNIKETDEALESLKALGYSITLADNDGTASLSLIPRIIHQTFKDSNLSPDVQKAVNGLRKMNPTFEYRFYNDQDCIDFITNNYPPEYLEDYLSINANYGSARADFFRYLLMYKVGGVYLDIKSTTLEPLEESLLPTDEYILTHWEGKDWNKELNYVHGEFQNWNIICRPEHPFLKKVIEEVRNNLHNYSGELGKEAVLHLTGPIAYSKAILKILDKYRLMTIDSPVREFGSEIEVGLIYMATAVHHHFLYPNSYHNTEPIVEIKKTKEARAWVLYANKAYIKTVQACVRSLNMFSTAKVIVYLINCDEKINGAVTVNWKCDVPDIEQKSYIDRKDPATYRMLIERPMIVKNALVNYANEVCYVDADSVATPHVNTIYRYVPQDTKYPYFVESIYDYLHVDGRGGADSRDDMSTTLEAPACDLFSVNQYVRQRYRQTGYFVANMNCIDFLDEWYTMCTHPVVMADNAEYAPYNEETIANVLLWKYNFMGGLPYIYCNTGLDRLSKIIDNQYPWGEQVESWFRLPENEEQLFFLHGEKEATRMNQMADMLNHTIFKQRTHSKMNILFLAPHLSTGGMPAFLLKRIEALQQNPEVEIYVVEWQCVSPHFVVQRNKIIKLVKNFYSLGNDKNELMEIIKTNRIDIVHIDEMVEHLDGCSFDLKSQLYSPDRTWRIIETCHNVVFNPDGSKQFHPDAYAFCTPYHLDVFERMPSYKEVIQFPIDSKPVTFEEQLAAQESLGMASGKSHVLNIGLWTKGKNQGEGLKIARKYPHMQFHFVGNRAGNFEDYWKPLMRDVPSNVTIWDEREDVDTFYRAADIFMFNSTFECSPLALREAISYGLPIIARDLLEYRDMFTPYLQPINTDLNSIIAQYDVPSDNTTEDFGKNHYEFYSTVIEQPVVLTEIVPNKVSITQHFVNNPFLEITGDSTADYLIKFFDEKNVCHYENTIKSNHWVQLNRSYFTKWTAKVWEDGDLIYDEALNFKGKKVFIVFNSRALGDTIAWIPYCLEFQKKHDCKVFVCTFHNKLFKSVYPELTFVEPGGSVNGLIGMYHIGSHDDHDSYKEPENTVEIPLQKVACNILGLEYKEIRPNIKFNKLYNKHKKKYVTIATNSTAGCKFWQKENWQTIIDYLVNKGYLVINVSKEKNEFKNCTQILDDSINNTMNIIHYSEFFIGLSSGLSWLAWALEKEVLMIANFTRKDYEFKCHRPVNTSVCNSCFNNPKFKFDKGDWDWCPMHKGTSRQWECQNSITADQVIDHISAITDGIPVIETEVKEFDWGWMNSEEGQIHKSIITEENSNNTYEKEFEVEEGDIVLDIGASVGTFTYSILNKNPKQVFCVEPSEIEFPTLLKNTEGFPVVSINAGISNKNGIVTSEYIFGKQTTMPGMTFKTLCSLYNINHIDFLKTDCEGGEYDIFTLDNLEFIQKNVKKIAGEFHLGDKQLNNKFRIFRDTILSKFSKVKVCAIDGVDITYDLWNEHLLEYYTEIIIYIDNR